MILPLMPPECSPDGAIGAFKSTSNARRNSKHEPFVQQIDQSYGRGWVVQKFGGTSIGKFALDIVKDIVEVNLKQQRIAVVCSARSSSTKLEGTTTRLTRAAVDVLNPHSSTFREIVEQIRIDHIQAGRDALKHLENNKLLLKQYTCHVNRTCQELLKILTGAQRLRTVTHQTEDMIISYGEKLSCLYMTVILHSRNVNAVYIDCSQIVDFEVGDDLDERFYSNLSCAISAQISSLASDVIPVITGYFGPVPGGLLKRVGRGYTDLCAAIVAVGLGAKELQVWKEVDGIFTADPQKVPSAHLLRSVSPEEAAELTICGSEVIHPFTMDQVMRVGIPVRIANVKRPQDHGTIIQPSFENAPVHFETSTIRECASIGSRFNANRPGKPLAITSRCGVTVLNIHSKHKAHSHGFLASIFDIIASRQLRVDLISSSEADISIVLHSEYGSASGSNDNVSLKEHESLRGAIEDLSAWGRVDIVPNMAIISLIGAQLKSSVCVSGRFFSTLGENGINVEVISQGASEINISCVVEEAAVDCALNAVHASMLAVPP